MARRRGTVWEAERVLRSIPCSAFIPLQLRRLRSSRRREKGRSVRAWDMSRLRFASILDLLHRLSVAWKRPRLALEGPASDRDPEEGELVANPVLPPRSAVPRFQGFREPTRGWDVTVPGRTAEKFSKKTQIW